MRSPEIILAISHDGIFLLVCYTIMIFAIVRRPKTISTVVLAVYLVLSITHMVRLVVMR